MLRLTMNTPVNLTTRVVSRALFPCLLLCLTAILLSRVQASRDPSLRALLLPTTGCAAPCFLGIQPGVTTVKAGLQALRANSLIRSITSMAVNPSAGSSHDLYEVDFAQPLTATQRMQMQLVTHSDSDVIDSIVLSGTGIQLSQIELTFGQPESIILDESLHLGILTYASFYPQYQIYVQTVMALCAGEAESFWDQRQDVLIGIASSRRYAEQRAYYSKDAGQTREGWRQRLHNMEQEECTQPASNTLVKALEAAV